MNEYSSKFGHKVCGVYCIHVRVSIHCMVCISPHQVHISDKCIRNTLLFGDVQACETMLQHPRCKRALQQYARVSDSILQRVVIKVIYSTMEDAVLKYVTSACVVDFLYLKM